MTDSKKGKNIQFRFMNNGLLKGEHCIYLTHENPTTIKNQMISTGIDVDKFTNSNQLDIYKFPNLLNNPQRVLRGFQDLFDELTKDLKSACRVVGRAIQDVSTDEGMAAEMQIERFVHSTFNTFNGMILCHYDYSQLPPAKSVSCVYQLCGCHHGAIMSTRAEPGFAFSM